MLPESDARYRIFISESDHDKLPATVVVEESYPAFAVVRASAEAIDECRRFYPVEPFGEPKSPPAMPDLAGLAESATTDSVRGPYTLVMRFRSPVRSEWLEEVTAIGCKHLGSLGSSSIVLHCPTKRIRARLGKLPYVAAVWSYLPEIKIAAILNPLGEETSEAMADPATAALAAGPAPASGSADYVIPGMLVASFFGEDDRQAAQRKLEREKVGNSTQAGATDLIIDLTASTSTTLDRDLSTIIELHNLRSLEEKSVDTILNNLARTAIAARVIASPPTGLGLTGKGEIVAVADTGLDTGDLTTLHLDFRGRIHHMQSFPFNEFYLSLLVNPRADDGVADLNSGHGTHVCGSVLGNGTRASQLHLSEQIRGTAPEAALVFQAIEQTAEWNASGKMFWLRNGKPPPASGLFAIPVNLQVLLQAAYDQGARIHSNSWSTTGSSAWGDYSTHSLNLDKFMWKHPDFLAVVAAGNEAEPGSVASPGTAKNCLTVGACGNNRNGHSLDTIASFSSRGPTAKGRQKPDVVAPGMDILSTRSSLSQANGSGIFEQAPDAYFFDSGTSMATPLVAGSAALVRQYLRERLAMAQPSAALVKAAIIHAGQYRRSATAPAGQLADNEQGWGRVDLDMVLNPPSPVRVIFVDSSDGLSTGVERRFRMQVGATVAPLRVTLAYTDFPGPDLVNNLNLIVRAPDGSFFVGNDFDGDGAPDSQNNVEGVLITEPQQGDWTIHVVGSNVPEEPQNFALVVSAAELRQIQ